VQQAPNPLQGLPHKSKSLIDSLAAREAPAVVCPASVVVTFVARADMESASSVLNGRDPWAYLRNVLVRLPTSPNSRNEELPPHRWQPKA